VLRGGRANVKSPTMRNLRPIFVTLRGTGDHKSHTPFNSRVNL